MTKKQYYMFLLALFVGVPIATIGLLTTNVLANPFQFFFVLSAVLISISNMLFLFLGIDFIRKTGMQNLSFNTFINFIKRSKLVIVLGVLYACTIMMMTTFVLFQFLSHFY